MNRAEFIRTVARRNGIPKQQAYRYVTATMDTISVVLSEEGKIELKGFGKFLVVPNLKGKRIPVFIAERTFSKNINDCISNCGSK